MAIITVNLTEFMGPVSSRPAMLQYVATVATATDLGTYGGPFTSTCPECGNSFADLDEAYEDDEHILITTASDTVAVVVACEGYFVVNPNKVGIDSPNWTDASGN